LIANISAWGGCPGSRIPEGQRTKSSVTFGLIFVIVFFGGLFLFFTIGFVISCWVQKKKGLQAIPLLGFWISLFGYVKV
jgi:hypothetical protein